MHTRSTFGLAAAVLLALPGCERLLDLSHVEWHCSPQECGDRCGAVDDGCGAALDCGPCAQADGGPDASAEADAGSAACGDGVKNHGETDVDCGGSCPKKCADGRGCSSGADCASGQCASGACVPSCEADNGGCDPNATCSNAASGRTCTCKSGYLGDGMTCQPGCRRPKVMLALDRSVSMMQSLGVSQTQSYCWDGNFQYDPSSSVDCKWKHVQAALSGASGVLATTKGAAFWGLAVLNGSTGLSDSCTAGDKIVDVGDSSDNVDAVVTALESLVPVGGTPAGPTLQKLASDFSLVRSSVAGQERYVLLLSGGAADCSPASKTACEACIQGCDGYFGFCAACYDSPCNATVPMFASFSCESNNFCLDDTTAAAAVTNLASLGVKTFVVGFGADTASGKTADILNGMAIAGGLARDASAPSRFYQASTQAELEQALAAFADLYIRPCAP